VTKEQLNIGKSEALIKIIRKEYMTRVEKGSGENMSTPAKEINTRPKNTKVHVNNFDKCVIWNIIYYFYATKNVVPTAATLLPIVRDRINFTWRRKSLIRIVKSADFRW
jgi:hypothetical protein